MKIEISFKNQKVNQKIKKIVTKVVNLVCKDMNIKHKDFELSVLLVENEFMRELNMKYRNRDRYTNVLSFPQNNFSISNNSIMTNLLGDVVISVEQIKEESILYSKDFYEHFIHIFLHGFLHLLGYSHDCKESAKSMETKEVKILSSLDIADPYLIS